MAYTDIDDPSEYFHTQLYTGNATARSITNSANAGNFQPDWLWIKVRNNANNHRVFDSSRGANLDLVTNLTQADSDSTDRCTGFDANGFSLGVNAEVNSNTHNIVAWQWKANGGTTSSNSDGSITSTVQANTDAGFSIVTYTGTGSNATIGHGLGVAPKMIIQKNRDESQPWWTYVESIGAGGQLRLNGTQAEGSDGGVLWNSTAPTSSVFSVGDNTGTNGSSDACIAYCFAEKQGYSKIGSYVGNGSTDGPFIHTGFKPAWVMIKRTSGSENWVIWDNQRDPFNNFYHVLLANASSTEDTTNAGSGGRYVGDFLSNGFKLRNTHDTSNASGSTYIYMAFAEHPFVSSKGVPTTAR